MESNRHDASDIPNHSPPGPPPHLPPRSSAQDDNSRDIRDLLRNVANRTLIFLSNASNETLGACLVGLGASTYIIFGRVGLVLIGVVGGVVLQATWDGSRGGGPDGGASMQESSRRREVGLDIVHRVLDWRVKNTCHEPGEDVDALGIAAASAKVPDYSAFQAQTADALAVFTDAVIRDYVKWWYSPILPEELSFPSTCRRTLTNFIVAFSSNLSRKRPADTFLEFTTNSSSIVIVFFNELTAALQASPTTNAADAIQTYLQMKPQSNLGSIMDRKHQQRKLQMVADDILESYLDQNVYRCPPPRIFLREILANVILEMTIQKCSRAEWINEWIVYLLEEGEPELMNVIDAGVESAGAQNLTKDAVQDQVESDSLESGARARARAHSRSKSRAEEAMDEAMREAQRLTQLIVEEDKKRGTGHGQLGGALDSGEAHDSTNRDISAQSTLLSEGKVDPTLGSSHPNPDIIPEEQQQEVIEEHQQATQRTSRTSFTDFDQLGASQVPTALQEQSQSAQSEFLTLRNAHATIFDDVSSSDKRPYKAKPTIDYMIQIEPASSGFSGWMIARTYTDFETLHEVLRRISNITGVEFNSTHNNVPPWKGFTRPQLCAELERYLNDALRFEQLAESEGMKRFLEKSRGLTQSGNKGFWPNPANVGKGMRDVLSKAPNQVAGGGKAFFGGVQNVFTAGNANAGKRTVPNGINSGRIGSPRPSADLSPTSTTTPNLENHASEAPSHSRPPSAVYSSDGRPAPLRRSSSQISHHTMSTQNTSPRSSLFLERPAKSPKNPTPPNELSEYASNARNVKLPPPPEDMPDDYSGYTKYSPRINLPERGSHASTSQMSVDGTNFFDVPTPPTPRSPRPRSPHSSSEQAGSPPVSKQPSSTALRQPPPGKNNQNANNHQATKSSASGKKLSTPLTEQEAQVTIELLFAVINELYTLSSAWQIRRTLLTAAKTFLLRPGNPQLESIRLLLQESVLDANGSDAGMAAHILKLRENTLPTEEEYKAWPAERNAEEKEKLRVKARKLLCERGMPQALTSVMGAAASGEALGKVFDCLQVEEVARGVVFGLVLQGIRAVTQ